METRIEFMNIKRQMSGLKKEIMAAIENVIADTAFSGGEYSAIFEKEFSAYVNAKYCSGVSSGTSALFMAMKAIGIKPGDEVIVPANTFIASAWGPYYCGAKPIFVDCDPDTWEISAESVKKNITDKTKAIVGVHLYGQPFDIDAIKEIAQSSGIIVVEDCAQAHGAEYKGSKVGALCDVGCFSFYPGKNLGALGEAGAVTTNNEEYFDKIEILKNHGSKKRYYHDVEGYNLRLDGIQGAALSVKLKYLNQWNQARKEISDQYNMQIHNPRIKKQYIPDDVNPVHHLFEIEVDNVDRFLAHMQSKDIICGRHYPVPCHLQKVFSELGYKQGDFPVAEYHAAHCVSLPMFPEMSQNEIGRVIDACNDFGI